MQHQQYDRNLGLPPSRSPTGSDSGSAVSAAPPYAGFTPLTAKEKLPTSKTSSTASSYTSLPPSPDPAGRPHLTAAGQPSPSMLAAPSQTDSKQRPLSIMSDIESVIDTFAHYKATKAKEKSKLQQVLDSGESAEAEESAPSSTPASAVSEEVRDLPTYPNAGAGDNVATEEQARVRAGQDGRSIEEWRQRQREEREEQEFRTRAAMEARAAERPPSSRSGTSTLSAGTRRIPHDPRRRPSHTPSSEQTAAESAAAHHFRLAQQHLEAAQRLAQTSSLSLQIDRPSITRTPSFDASSPFDDRGGRPFDPFDDGQSESHYAETAYDEDPTSPEGSSYYDTASEFGYGSYGSQGRFPPRRKASMSSVSTSAPSYRSNPAPPLPPIPSLSSSAGSAHHQPRYDGYQPSPPRQRAAPLYVAPRQQSNLAPGSMPMGRPGRSDSLPSSIPEGHAVVPGYATTRHPSPSAPPIDDSQTEVLGDEWTERRLPKVPVGTQWSQPRRAPSLPRPRAASSPPPPPSSAGQDRLPHPSTFTQEQASFVAQAPPAPRSQSQQSQYWPALEHQPHQQQREYAPSEVSSQSHLPTYQPSRAHPHSQPPHHQPAYAPSLYGQPTSYILSPTGVPIPVYAAIPQPPPLQALAVHSQPLQYDHRLPYGSSAPVAAPQSAPTYMAAPPARQGGAYFQPQPQPQGQTLGVVGGGSILRSNSTHLLSHQPSTVSLSSTLAPTPTGGALDPTQHHPYVYASPTRPNSASSSSSSSRLVDSDRASIGGGSLKNRMAHLREKLGGGHASPHVRFQSEQEQGESQKSKEKEMGVQRRDDAVAAMNKTFKMLM